MQKKTGFNSTVISTSHRRAHLLAIFTATSSQSALAWEYASGYKNGFRATYRGWMLCACCRILFLLEYEDCSSYSTCCSRDRLWCVFVGLSGLLMNRYDQNCQERWYVSWILLLLAITVSCSSFAVDEWWTLITSIFIYLLDDCTFFV